MNRYRKGLHLAVKDVYPVIMQTSKRGVRYKINIDLFMKILINLFLRNINYRCGIGVCSPAQYSHSFAQMERYLIRRIEYVIGGQMLIVHLQPNCIAIMKSFIEMVLVIRYDIRIEM